MLVRLVTLAVFLFAGILTNGRQIPVVNGVIGGVRDDSEWSPDADFAVKAAISPAASTPTPGKLRVVENSGICETTPGVFQASGYGDLTSSKSLWFWFFAARENPETAPFVIWLNGGPGSSSMIGLFQEHGPCRISNNSETVSINPNSWNNVANILYLDQPVGVGFSYGTLNVGTSSAAAQDVWTFLQIFLSDSRFSSLQENEFAVWTESYGGHYGPTFADFFLQQNAAIETGSLTGIPLNLKVLAIGDGLTDPLNQYPGYITYAASNPYHALVSSSTISKASTAWSESGGCQAQIQSCYNTNSTSTCSKAQSFCNNDILSPLVGPYDDYFILARDPDPYPPDLTPYLSNTTLLSVIGAQSTWEETNDQVYDNFAKTGDWMTNSAPHLENVINAGVRTLIYDGDADYILNFNGVENMINALQTKFSAEFQAQSFSNFTVAGQPAGLFKNAGTFSYVRIFGAGHEVPAYAHGTLGYGEAALQFFTQIMSGNSLSAT